MMANYQSQHHPHAPRHHHHHSQLTADSVDLTAPPLYDITVDASLVWVPLAEYDNRTNAGSITELTKFKVEESIERTEFDKEFSETSRKQLKESGTKTELGASYEGVSAKIEGNLKVSDEVSQTVQHTCETTVKTDYKFT